MNEEEELFTRQLAEDRYSGAAEIVKRVAEYLHSDLDAWISDLKRLTRFGLECIYAQPSMAPLINLFNDLLWGIQESSDGPAAAEEVFSSYLKKPDLTPLPEEYCPPGSTILTLSYSSTVLDILLATRGQIEEVVCLESRPLCEGRTMAQKLAEGGIGATVVVDAAIAEMTAEADLVVTGADCVHPGGLINKQGTHALALVARSMEKHLLALASGSIMVGEEAAGRFIQIVQQNPDEVWESPPRNVSVQNRYFEVTPLRFFNSFLIDSNVLYLDEVLKELEEFQMHPLLISASS